MFVGREVFLFVVVPGRGEENFSAGVGVEVESVSVASGPSFF